MRYGKRKRRAGGEARILETAAAGSSETASPARESPRSWRRRDSPNTYRTAAGLPSGETGRQDKITPVL